MPKEKFIQKGRINSHDQDGELPASLIDQYLPEGEGQEIVLFDSTSQALPNPFLAAFLIEDARRQRRAENEMGE